MAVDTESMKKSFLFIFSLTIIGFLLVGYGPNPRPYSDLATYKRIPTTTRIDRLMKAGEDLYLRRLYEEARDVFKMILDMDKDNLTAKYWMAKINNVFYKEQNERNKQALYKKWGHLTPIDKIYENWHWGPETGHFEVRYSEPKPYPHYERKFRPKATDAEVNQALQAYKKSKTADNAFELAMRYWSQRKENEAIKYYLEAVDLSSEVLGKDDEYMLSMISEKLEDKLKKGETTAQNYLTHGRLALLQGNSNDGVRNLLRASKLDKKLAPTVKKAIENYITNGFPNIVGIPAEYYSFRQAYVFDKNKDRIYMRIILYPIHKRPLIPIDTTIPLNYIENISIASKDVLYVFNKPGIDNSARLWVTLPEKDGEYPEYEIKLVLDLKRGEEDFDGVELSNFGLYFDQDDNWSFIISSEFDEYVDPSISSDFEKTHNGVRVTGYCLSSTEGKGPFVIFNKFNEPLPSDANIWKIMENKEDEMDISLN